MLFLQQVTHLIMSAFRRIQPNNIEKKRRDYCSTDIE